MTIPEKSIDLVAQVIAKIWATMLARCRCEDHRIELPVHATLNVKGVYKYYDQHGKTTAWGDELANISTSPHHGFLTTAFNDNSTYFLPQYEHLHTYHYHSRQ
ncbi:hypothetical protein P153DRAFT_400974 [Dothidotthia symphoricarpi CBS 119687]|uniref:Uncharacterized protein n=1 Tax=Dothidotthia symphoricarpi CBS 119687 TaxID=1392245 RepID=A0A6A5ZZ92_9PLEO|nr:uncharacterized protein P153DRAFT_400974 [Dothidotthia symphoricarpi CBS 119687]KAF2124345.1 hypothetical protein P153DRAFT_400974 [Dothidotthia symphoricarpi CBS 119687]